VIASPGQMRARPARGGDDSLTRGEDMTGEQEQWQLDASAPELYQRCLVPAMTAMWACDLASRAALLPGHRVLDVACGTGVVARVAAERVSGDGRVAGLDINPGMLAVARSLPAVAAPRSRGTAVARSRCPSPLRRSM
jgi:SAM-dependent methyltransferase